MLQVQKVKRIKLYTFHNDDFKKLKERFLSTLKDDYEVICKQQDLRVGDKVWCGGETVWLFKTRLIIDAIKANWDDVIIISDIDIQFFKPTKEIVFRAIAARDIVFQRNAPLGHVKINIGFMAIRCNERCLTMFEWVFAKIMETKKHDQKLVEVYLENHPGRINYALFPKKIFAYNPIAIHHGLTHGIALHHAIWVRSGSEKLSQMERIRLLAEKPWFLFYVWKIKRIPESIIREMIYFAKRFLKSKEADLMGFQTPLKCPK